MAQELFSLMDTKRYHPQNTTLLIGVSRDTSHWSVSPHIVFSGNKCECLSRGNNKQALINIISGCLRDEGCIVINYEGDSDCEILHPTIAASECGSTTLITDLLVLLLYYMNRDNKSVFFHSDKTIHKLDPSI